MQCEHIDVISVQHSSSSGEKSTIDFFPPLTSFQGHGYHFGYDITDPHGAKNSRKESDDGYGNKVSSAEFKEG